MAQEFIQASFNSGEWAPHLWSRVDLEKYHTGAALLENFFVDYRGGASTRSGTKYIIRAYKDSTAVRLIGFQAAVGTGFILECGEQYIRFHRNGFPVLESALAITGATQTNPCVVSVANSYATGDIDWVYISGMTGMTELNGKFFIVHASTAGTITLYDLFGNPVDASGFGAYVGGGTVQRIYTLTTPYAATDLALLKFAQNIAVMILCNANYTPKTLTLNAATSWALADIIFGASVDAPTGAAVATTLAGGTFNYSYVVTAVDADGEESAASSPAALANKQDLRTTAGTNTVTWNAVNNAVSYNVYKAEIVSGVPVPAGAQYGFAGNSTSTTFVDSNIAQDYSQPFPIPQNPFETNQTVVSATVTVGGSYATTPSMNFSSPPTGITALGYPVFRVITAGGSFINQGAGYLPGDQVFFNYGIAITVLTTLAGQVLTYSLDNPGTSAGIVPTVDFSQISTTGAGTGLRLALNWEVYDIVVSNGGSGYTVAPTISFSAGAAAATAVLSGTPTTVSNPSVPAFFQQRLVLAAPTALPQTLYMSQPGAYFNFDISSPVQEDDAITASIVTSQLNNIKSLVPQPGGLIVLTDGASVLLNGGSQGSAVTPIANTANPQSFFGANDMPPIVVNYDVLSVPAKGSSVRDSTYNFYANVYTGADITTISSHLFFGYQLQEWAWAEEPYKVVWAVRNDGALLSLTFVKEQEFIAWTHHYTEKTSEALLGQFKSVASIVEAATIGYQNFTYFVVQRTINGQSVKYIEYFPERATSGHAEDYWTVDCGIQYVGSPATSFSGGEFLAGKTCTGLADGVVIPPFVMPASGNFTLATAASKVTVGLAFVANLQTLYIDIAGGQTIQTKMKQIPQITLRVTETLGLKCGTDDTNLVEMKDLVLGNVGGMTNELVTDLVTGDARTVIDPKWQEKGQIYVRQDQPYPASILGFIPSMGVEGMKG